MAKQIQTPDPMVAGGEIVYGTALFRVSEIIDDQPADQECVEFYAGDIRDVCNTCDVKDKSFQQLRDKVKGRQPGELVKLVIADVRQLVRAAQYPVKTETAN